MRRPTPLSLGMFATITFLCMAASTICRAQDSTFAKANRAFNEGHFQESVDAYQGLVRSGQWSATLFYDLGNAWFRLGDFGQAILNYERALALDPRHPETRANLRLARDEARALELETSPIERHFRFATTAQYSIAVSTFFWLSLFIAVVLFFSSKRSGKLAILMTLFVVLSIGGMIGLYTMETGGEGRELAIVTGKDVEARLATADNSKGVLALPAGSQIKILSERGDWIYAALPNNLRGWIPATSAVKVRL